MSWPKGNTQGSGPGPPGRGRPNGRSGHPWMPQSGESEYPSLSTAAGLPRTAGGNADARRHPSRAPTGPTPPRPGSDHASRSVSRQPRGPRAPFPPTMMAQSPYQRVSVPAQMMPLLSPPVAMGYPYPMNSGQYIRPPIGMAQLPMMPPHPVFYNPPPPPSVEPPQEAPTRTIQGPYAKEVASFLLDEGHKEELEANKFGVTVEFLHSSGWKDEAQFGRVDVSELESGTYQTVRFRIALEEELEDSISLTLVSAALLDEQPHLTLSIDSGVPVMLSPRSSITGQVNLHAGAPIGAIRTWLLLQFETARVAETSVAMWSSRGFAIARTVAAYSICKADELPFNPVSQRFVRSGWQAFNPDAVRAVGGPVPEVVWPAGRIDGSPLCTKKNVSSFIGSGAANWTAPHVHSLLADPQIADELTQTLVAQRAERVLTHYKESLTPNVSLETSTAEDIFKIRASMTIRYRNQLAELVLLEEMQHALDVRYFDLHAVRLSPVRVGEPTQSNSRQRRQARRQSGTSAIARLEIPGLAEKRPGLNLRDSIRLRRPDREIPRGERPSDAGARLFMKDPPERWVELPAEVVNFQGNTATIRFNLMDAGSTFRLRTHSGAELSKRDTINSEAWFVRHSHNAEVFRLMHDALEKLPEDCVDVPWVWPIAEGGGAWGSEEAAAFASDAESIPWVFKGLNKLQETAVVGVLRCVHQSQLRAQDSDAIYSPSPPFVIFGPPGTGKTVTVIEATWQLLKLDDAHRVLLCAPSNAAADVLCDRLRALGLPPEELHRFCWTSRKLEFVLPQLLPFCAQSQEGTLAYLPVKDLLSKRVIVCTCFSAGLLAELGVPKGHFSAIFVDEAGQASEAETLIPLINFNQYRQGGKADTVAVLAGDPLQLGAVCRSPHAKGLGYDTSLLERLMLLPLYSSQKAHGRLLTKLLFNYRSHEGILHMSSSAFYDSELKACADPRETDSCLDWATLEDRRFPVVFFGVDGQAICPEDSASPFNREEANTVANMVVDLLSSSLALTTGDFGIVAPYRNQVKMIRKVLRERDLSAIRVGTVDDYQGQESKVLIISTTITGTSHRNRHQADPLGLISDPKRFNVAVSRAKALCLIVGNPLVLLETVYWGTVVKYCIDHGTYRGWSPEGLPALSVADDFEDDEIVSATLRRLHAMGSTKPWTSVDSEPDMMQIMFEELEWRVEV